MKTDKTGQGTQMTYARKGIITDAMAYVAKEEQLPPEQVRDEVAKGTLIIPANVNHPELRPIGIGISTRCKINANIGNSQITSDISEELEKLDLAVKYGADTVMDLSTGKRINEIREAIIRHSTVPIGTVPVYQAAEQVRDFNDLSAQDMLGVIEMQAKQGVDYITIHCGLLREHIPLAADRLTGIVSRGGSLMAQWMMHHKKQNPLFTHFDDVLAIARRHDVSLSLGDGLRPGCLADASDEAMLSELKILGELTKRAWEQDVQVMIEGPGHMPMHHIKRNVELQQKWCSGAPFYVLGPLVVDIAPGYDHITSAIGGALIGWYGASMLCYVTPKEHLGLPNPEDVRVGVVSHKIAAHAADIARGRPGVRDRDDEMAKARYGFDWKRQFELSLDPERAESMHDETLGHESYKTAEYCSMCGPKFCAMRITKEIGNIVRDDGTVVPKEVSEESSKIRD